ncbi:MAG: alanine--glyoxylate aminotransferase family protein [Clostridia bacterium]
MEYDLHQLNFAVGPVMMEDDILALGKNQVPYFRTPEFSTLMKENEAMMKELVDADSESRAVFLTGSGTAAMEAAVINTFNSTDFLLVVDGGSFGHRFCEICEIHAIPFTRISLEYGELLTQAHLAPFRQKGYTGFLINMHETSTGVLYDMQLVSRFCQDNALLLIVDAISSFIADPISMRNLYADIVLTGSQKALAVPPGVSILVINERTIKRICSQRPTCLYLDLQSALKNGERGQTPFTPAVGILYQLHKRMSEILKRGIEAERARMREVALDFRRRSIEFPFTIPSRSLSNAMTPLSPTNGRAAYEIYEILKSEYQIIVCPNGGELASKLFRVGHMGNVSIKDTDTLLAALQDMQRRGLL